MANVFWRKPISGGDENNWDQYNDAHILEAIGECNVTIYDNGGTLTISKGRIGINDGTNQGVAILDTEETPSIAGIANSHWAEVYMTVSAGSVSFTVLQMADTDPSIIPSTFTGAYNPEKGGYYIVATRRCIALIWKGSGGNLDGIINVLNNSKGYNGYCYLNNAQTEKMMWQIIKESFRNWAIIDIGDWNMTGFQVVVNHSITNWKKIRNMDVIIRNDPNTGRRVLNTFYNVPDPNLLHGGIREFTSTTITLERRTGGVFDSTDYDSTTYNRGWIYCELAE